MYIIIYPIYICTTFESVFLNSSLLLCAGTLLLLNKMMKTLLGTDIQCILDMLCPVQYF